MYLLPDLLPAGDVGAALVDAEVGLADVSGRNKELSYSSQLGIDNHSK